MNGSFKVGTITNEPILGYLDQSPERRALFQAIENLSGSPLEIPCIVNGKEIFTGDVFEIREPHDHRQVLARLHLAGPKETEQAIAGALAVKKQWASMTWSERTRIFLKAADLLASPEWRSKINAATMLGQSKNIFQAEIDSACELIDFLRFNASFYEAILQDQPISVLGIHNSVDYRPLDGFILAITPFNFTAIAGNLPAAPAMVGNTVVWKPSEQQGLSAYLTYKLFQAAGLPEGVIQFLPARGPTVGQLALSHPDLGGVHFTGSTATFNHIQKTVGSQIELYKGYPRIVGETGGKDFVFADSSADLDVLRVALIRGAYEYQGQKCSAASRAYVPASVWEKLKKPLVDEIRSLKMGDVRDAQNFVNAVIDERAFTKIDGYLRGLKAQSTAEILAGGESDRSKGYFISPTLALTQDPKSVTMVEEIFGPVLSLFVFPDHDIEKAAEWCATTSPYALTGAIISQDRQRLMHYAHVFDRAAGNLYLNDKPTGAVVGQQPFGGDRRSGTNDKAGSRLNILRWLSPRTVKENFVPPKSVLYPYMNS